MAEFMKTHKVYLTPISPIHIGCGEDFEPTNYVIDVKEDLLYEFDPSQLSLTEEQRSQLLDYIENEPKKQLGNIYSFFAKDMNLVEQIKEKSKYIVDVSKELVAEWQSKLGKEVQSEPDSKVFNKLAIERHIYNPLSKQAYIPGSSIKGSIITVILNQYYQQDELTNKERNSDNLSELLREKYFGKNTDKNRKDKLLSQCIRVSDCMPVYNSVTKVFYANNYPKISNPKDRNKGVRGFDVRRESIIGGQYRAYQATLNLLDGKFDIKTLFSQIRDFYIPIFEKESEIQVRKGLLEKRHFENIRKIIENKNVALIRLGKSGSEDKVLQDHSIRQIKVKLKKKEAQVLNSATAPKPESTTFWLAGDNDQQESNVLPFGWAILEYSDLEQDNSVLKNWCESLPKTKRQYILAKAEKEEMERREKQAKAELLNSLSPNKRTIMEFIEKLKNTTERQADNTGSVLLKEAEVLINQAVEWEFADRQFVFEQITVDFLKSKIDFKKKDTEKNVKKWRNKLGIA
ncbi:TPA: RAMP superfamily CRISPR-associated protein [Mannheimia haemolytica]